MSKVHHAAITTEDVDTSLRFWVEGLGFSVLMDEAFEGDWPTLFGVTTTELRSLFLGSPSDSNCGIVELVQFERIEDEQPGDRVAVPPVPLRQGFFLLSLHADLDSVLPRLSALGVGGDPRVSEVAPGVRLCVVIDPNGVVVELMDGAYDLTAG